MASVKNKEVENIQLDELDMRDELDTKPMPLEELEPVQLDEEPEHLVYVGSKLSREIKNLLIHFLIENAEVFAWK